MNDKRISLSRIIAVNWYGFRQILDVSGHTLVAGAFGTGKTALLDLLQYVLLGSHWRPNRAAAGNVRSRSLVSYCLCDTNTRQNGQPHYTRQSGVTFIGLEFSWPRTEAERRQKAEPRRETWGMRVEFSSATAEPRITWFGIPDRLEWDQMAPGGTFLEEDAFRSWLRREYGRECLFSRQIDYLNEMATPHHLYFEAEAFCRTLPKAIAFEPEDNVEKFLREFVLEESTLDVRDVRASVAAYRETHAILANQRDEAVLLREVCEHHERLEEASREEAALRHVSRLFFLDQAHERHQRLSQELENLRRDSERDRAALEEVRRELEETRRIVESTRLEVSSDPQAVELEKLGRRRAELHAEISRAEESRASFREQCSALRMRWNAWLRRGDDLAARDPLCSALRDVLAVDPATVERLVSPNDAAAAQARESLAAAFPGLWQNAAAILKEVRRQEAGQQGRLQQLAADLETLGRNEELGVCPVFRALREKLGDRVRQLGRLIEVREEADRWWPALEIFLGARRYVLVVGKSDYKEALEILRRTPPGREPESLLNPWEAEKLDSRAVPDSLAAKVEIEDPLARPFVNHLLGDVACVESAEALDQCPAGRAITPEGIFKQIPLRRRLLPEKDVPLTLGVRGRERLRAAREQEQITVRLECDRLRLLGDDVNAWLDSGKQSGLTAVDARPVPPDLLAELQAEWRTAGETIQLLSTPEREQRLLRLKEHEETQRQLHQKEGALRAGLDQFLPRESKVADDCAAAKARAGQLEEELVRLRAELPASLSPADLTALHDALMAEFGGWLERANAATERAGQAEARAASSRSARAAARHRLIDSIHLVEPERRHPQYRTDFDAEDDDNSRWAARLAHLDQIEIPKYELLAAERRRDWETRLRESVLDRLKERLDRAEDDIKALRHYLSHSIGRYRYAITQRRDPAFENIWRLLDTGFEPTDELLAGSGLDGTREALEELMRAVDASGGEIDERARRLLDYRYYHHYDIEMVLKDDTGAPAISLGRSMRSLSGGENQAPFFISMLAAFRRVYDTGSERSQHLGLVVMDEAFSKLSGDGVEDCLALAANFQLQLVMAFPIDRLGVMAPFADTVVICRKEEERDASGYITRIDNIPQRISAAEALDSLG